MIAKFVRNDPVLLYFYTVTCTHKVNRPFSIIFIAVYTCTTNWELFNSINFLCGGCRRQCLKNFIPPSNKAIIGMFVFMVNRVRWFTDGIKYLFSHRLVFRMPHTHSPQYNGNQPGSGLTKNWMDVWASVWWRAEIKWRDEMYENGCHV